MNSTIAVDIGNSFIKFGLFCQTEHRESLVAPDSLCVERTSTFRDLSLWLDQHQGRLTRFEWIVSSVNRDRTSSLLNWLKRNREPDPVHVVTLVNIPIPIRYDHPEKLGIDRALAAYGAKLQMKGTAPLIVVDIGTAVTIDYVDESGTFAGGAILPGPYISLQSLSEKTAQLPRTDFRQEDRSAHSESESILVDSPDDTLLHYPATNTEDAMRVGICHGLAGSIFAFYSHILASTGVQSLPIVMTGRSGVQMERHLESLFCEMARIYGQHTIPAIVTCNDLVLQALASIKE